MTPTDLLEFQRCSCTSRLRVVVFATLIAIFVLKERVTAARGAGIAVIALGAALLLMSK